jgi:hypothetical protein
MKVQRFEEFINERNDYGYNDQGYGPLKGKLSAFKKRERSSDIGSWLESVKGRVKDEMQNRDYKSGSQRLGDPLKVLGSISGFLLNIGAGVADALFGKYEKGEDYKKMSKEEIDRWERENFAGDKRITDKDAADFYMSGVMRGKKMFGDNFDPDDPKTEQEKKYSQDLYDATTRYYNRLKKR